MINWEPENSTCYYVKVKPDSLEYVLAYHIRAGVFAFFSTTHWSNIEDIYDIKREPISIFFGR